MIYTEKKGHVEQLKVLHIFSGVGGGISTWIKKAALFSEEKYVVDAMAFSITNKSNFIDAIENNGGKCIEMPQIKKGIWDLMSFLVETVRDGDYDLVHCHIDGYQAVPFWLAAHVICKKKVIIHSHRTAIEKVSHRTDSHMIYFFNRVINNFISSYKVACGDKAAKFAFGNTANVQIIHNGVNPSSVQAENHFQNDNIINLLALGRLNSVKNHKFMLQIANMLKQKGVAFHLYIVGDGELKTSIYNQIQKLNLTSNVSLEGYCDKPSQYFQMCDMLIMPSFSEGLPTVMLEAQEYGCKVISSDKVTKECDLGIGLVSFLGIEEGDSIKWCDEIIRNGKKNINLNIADFNKALFEKKFLNHVIYSDYYMYIKRIVEE